MPQGRKYVVYNGRNLSLKAWTQAFGIDYAAALKRWNLGVRDPWELLDGKGAKPRKLVITEEQKKWLRETKRYRQGQIPINGKIGHKDWEWAIACDLIGISRAFAEELKEEFS